MFYNEKDLVRLGYYKRLDKSTREKPLKWDVAICKYMGSGCLKTFMKVFSYQKHCQNCELQLGEIKETRMHFYKKDLKGHYYSNEHKRAIFVWKDRRPLWKKGVSGNINGRPRISLLSKLKKIIE